MNQESAVVLELGTDTTKIVNACQEVSLEALGVEGIMPRNAMQRLAAAVSNGFRSVTTWDLSRPDQLNTRQIKKVLKDLKFLDIQSVNFHKPLGFKGMLVDYSETIDAQYVPFMEVLGSTIIDQGSREISRFLNNPDELKSPRVNVKQPTWGEKERQQVITEVSKYFVHGNKSHEAPVVDLFGNKDEIFMVCDRINDRNDRIWKKHPPKKIAKGVRDFQEIATAFLTTATDGIEGANEKHYPEIAQLIENVARWVELYSVAQTHMIDLTVSMRSNQDLIFKNL